MLCFYWMLWYLSSIAILTTTRDWTNAACACPSWILTTLYSRQPTLRLHVLCLEFLIVDDNELRLFGSKSFPLLMLQQVQLLMHLAMTRFGQASNHHLPDATTPRTRVI